MNHLSYFFFLVCALLPLLDLFAPNTVRLECGVMPMSDRYFAATAMGQHLYVEGLSDHGTWDPGRLIFYPIEVVDMLMKPYPQDRRVHTEQELQSAVEESNLPAYRVWIHEGLIESTRRLWEESRTFPLK
jgi:hypothetical protein